MRPAIALVVAVAALALAFADVVELKTGQRIEGTLKQATPASVSIEVGGQVVTFSGEEVRAIYYGSASNAKPSSGSASAEAVMALKTRQSVASGNPTYGDYAPRVTDAKIVADRYLTDGTIDQAKAPVCSLGNQDRAGSPSRRCRPLCGSPAPASTPWL